MKRKSENQYGETIFLDEISALSLENEDLGQIIDLLLQRLSCKIWKRITFSPGEKAKTEYMLVGRGSVLED